jgi:hypothetical protein
LHQPYNVGCSQLISRRDFKSFKLWGHRIKSPPRLKRRGQEKQEITALKVTHHGQCCNKTKTNTTRMNMVIIITLWVLITKYETITEAPWIARTSCHAFNPPSTFFLQVLEDSWSHWFGKPLYWGFGHLLYNTTFWNLCRICYKKFAPAFMLPEL